MLHYISWISFDFSAIHRWGVCGNVRGSSTTSSSLHSLTLRCMACFSAFIKVNIFIHSRMLILTVSFSYQLLLHSFVSMVGLEIEMIPSYSPGCEFTGLVLRCPGSYICYCITPLKYHSVISTHTAEHKPLQSSVILFSFGFPTLMHARGTFCTYCNYWEIFISILCFSNSDFWHIASLHGGWDILIWP